MRRHRPRLRPRTRRFRVRVIDTIPKQRTPFPPSTIYLSLRQAQNASASQNTSELDSPPVSVSSVPPSRAISLPNCTGIVKLCNQTRRLITYRFLSPAGIAFKSRSRRCCSDMDHACLYVLEREFNSAAEDGGSVFCLRVALLTSDDSLDRFPSDDGEGSADEGSLSSASSWDCSFRDGFRIRDDRAERSVG